MGRLDKMDVCPASDKPISNWMGQFVDVNHGEFFSVCPECGEYMLLVHKQRPDSEFTKNTGFPDMVPYFIIHKGRGHIA